MTKKTFYRGRRLRRNEEARNFSRETWVTPSDLISPIFVTEGKGVRQAIDSMPEIERYSVDQLDSELEAVFAAKIMSVLLFGVPKDKDAKASGGWKESGVVQEAIARIKKMAPAMNVITDVCLCAYTDHGHCGHLKNGIVDNDSSLETLAQIALSHARAGADFVAPSDMMDGRVAAIREKLDENGFQNLPILSYSAKYASAFYGPFREAAKSGAKEGDRKSYQMDPPNVRQAMREIAADIDEGADMVMVKPALAYLDVIRVARQRFDTPIVAYNVSGEYSMVKAAAERGWLDEKSVVREILTAIKRAGADRIVTYHAKDFVRA